MKFLSLLLLTILTNSCKNSALTSKSLNDNELISPTESDEKICKVLVSKEDHESINDETKRNFYSIMCNDENFIISFPSAVRKDRLKKGDKISCRVASKRQSNPSEISLKCEGIPVEISAILIDGDHSEENLIGFGFCIDTKSSESDGSTNFDRANWPCWCASNDKAEWNKDGCIHCDNKQCPRADASGLRCSLCSEDNSIENDEPKKNDSDFPNINIRDPDILKDKPEENKVKRCPPGQCIRKIKDHEPYCALC